MKQNVVGLILFSFIISTAIIVSESFVTLPSPLAVEEKPVVFESKNRCGKSAYPKNDKSFAKISVTQAVLNPQTNKLNTSLLIEGENISNAHIGVTYHFFVKEGATTRFLASETVGIKPNSKNENKAVHEVLSSYSWLDNLNTKNNLYVIAEVVGYPFGRVSNSIPRFDEFNATPVLLMKDKN